MTDIPPNPSPQFHGLLRKPSALRFSARHSCLEVRRVSYRPPGTQQNLLNDISFAALQEKSFGLIFGRSGKTTLLQLLAGLAKPTSGSIYFQSHRSDGNVNSLPESLSTERVGIVFQFPERYFLADTALEEVSFGWPRQKADFPMRQQLVLNLQYAINSVQKPDLLLLDEPLAGLDWKARADVVKLFFFFFGS